MAFQLTPVDADEVRARPRCPRSPHAEALREFIASGVPAVEVSLDPHQNVRDAAATFSTYTRRLEVRDQVMVVQRQGRLFLLRK
jgi:hypothetical protein